MGPALHVMNHILEPLVAISVVPSRNEAWIRGGGQVEEDEADGYRKDGRPAPKSESHTNGPLPHPPHDLVDENHESHGRVNPYGRRKLGAGKPREGAVLAKHAAVRLLLFEL